MSVFAYLLYLLLAVVTYLLFTVKQRLNYWSSRGIECDKPHILLGSTVGVGIKFSWYDMWLNYYRKYRGHGPFVGFYWFMKPAVFVLDTALAKNILIKDFNKFTDRGIFSNPKHDPLSRQLFLLDGHRWRNLRNKLSPTFTSGKMKIMFPSIVNIAKEFVSVYEEMLKNSDIVEVQDIFGRFTTDVIGTCAFGIDCSSLKNPDAEFRVMGKKALTDFAHGKLGVLFRSSFPNLARMLHIKRTPEHIEEFFIRIVRETVAYREQNNVRRNDFMDMLIDMKNKKILKTERGDDFTNLTLEDVAAQAFVFLVAGFDTSSTTMTFALHELAIHEDMQQRAREEIDEALENHNGQYTYEWMKDLHYLGQIISETLRLYTVLPILNRTALEEYVVPGNPQYVIEKGVKIIIPACGIHRDERYYPNPDVFDPDNFSSERVMERDSIEWLPFGDGPRNCIGMRFGLMQSRVGLAFLLKNFKFSVCSQTTIPIKLAKKSFVIHSEGGIFLKVEKL